MDAAQNFAAMTDFNVEIDLAVGIVLGFLLISEGKLRQFPLPLRTRCRYGS
jgi:hypothetical protein